MAPKYLPSAATNWELTYNLGTYYPNWDQAMQNAVDQAFNKIDPNSPAGRVLNGADTGKVVFLQNASFHTGTDLGGLDHWNFVIRTLGAGGVQTSECHLYPSGRYTANGGNRVYEGNEDGAVQAPVVGGASAPVNDESNFPPLGR